MLLESEHGISMAGRSERLWYLLTSPDPTKRRRSNDGLQRPAQLAIPKRILARLLDVRVFEVLRSVLLFFELRHVCNHQSTKYNNNRSGDAQQQ